MLCWQVFDAFFASLCEDDTLILRVCAFFQKKREQMQVTERAERKGKWRWQHLLGRRSKSRRRLTQKKCCSIRSKAAAELRLRLRPASASAAAPASAAVAAVEGPRFRFFSKASASVEEVAMLKQPLPSAPPPIEKKKKRPAEAASDELEATPPAEGAAKKKSAKPRQLAFDGEVETSA